MRTIQFIGQAALVVLITSCGVQGPPLPPRIERPVQITDFSVVQQGRAFVLRFTLPTTATDGERLTKPVEIQVFRTVTPNIAPPAPPQGMSTPSLTLGPDDLRAFTDEGKVKYAWKISDRDYAETLGETYAFAVRGVTHGFRNRPIEGALSSTAPATLLDVSGAPGDLRARATEKAVELDWTPTANLLSGKPLSGLAGYRVYRSESGKPNSFVALTDTTAASCSDANFNFGRTYYYRVQALFKSGATEGLSDNSETVEITPRDVFPPTVPRDATAIYTAGAVEIVWTPSAEPDLAGYNVYRREAGGTESRLNKELVRTPVFRDQTVRAEQSYLYRVTAVDLTGNESAFSADAAIETR